VLEGTGTGHLRDELHAVVERYGRPTVLTTQAPYGGERLGGYASDGLTLALPNVIPGGSMTPETALVKLMWALGQGGDVRELMTQDLAGELVG
jgi:glutamyl-tRNA(Gln) amidotransferase subunit D